MGDLACKEEGNKIFSKRTYSMHKSTYELTMFIKNQIKSIHIIFIILQLYTNRFKFVIL
jgi:hypothetical protein